MIHLPASLRVYLCLTPRDMRKSFDSPQAVVREHLELDAVAGHLVVFTSWRKEQTAIPHTDQASWWLNTGGIRCTGEDCAYIGGRSTTMTKSFTWR